jgi:two-component system sensor histidine kinase BaeS
MSGWAMFVAGAAFGVLGTWFAAARSEAGRRRALSGPLHELRGALAAIQLGLFALERRGPVPLVVDRIDALRMQAERAHVAVEDVDDIRLARKSDARTLDRLDAGAVVRRRAAAWSGFAETRRRAVELRWPIGPAVVRADAERIGQALDNLIVNALDHGCGVVRVTGSVSEATVRITVADQGPGISRPLHELMDSPWRGRHGHGLALAARIAELHGGRLTARSGRIGLRVEIELPLAEPLQEQASGRPRLTTRSPMKLEPAPGGGS